MSVPPDWRSCSMPTALTAIGTSDSACARRVAVTMISAGASRSACAVSWAMVAPSGTIIAAAETSKDVRSMINSPKNTAASPPSYYREYRSPVTCR
ncbi:MAG: hypothetical protein ACMVO5_11515 [Polymorphobacter sp.]|uniref:hypothetical protein n=1 Tax=Polymorphobacter sp. TaxID=1909290 RepID=UPI003A84865B